MPTLEQQLFAVAASGKISAILELINQGADINARDDLGRTPAMLATYGHHTEALKALIEAGADINIRDNNKANPLLHAAVSGYLDIVKLAIDARADTTITNRFGGIAIIPASERGHLEIVRELLTRTDINVNHVNDLGWTALLEAIMLGYGRRTQQQIIQLLIEHGADVNLADGEGVRPLQHARQRGYTAIEQLLLEAGAR